jgi:predicted O-linked N-acetylglucosamine transferase (SPINDLY family)
MVTCLGSSFAGRVGASVLNAAGLSKLISRSLEDYEQLALRLATYDNALFALKDGLRMHRKTCALFDTDRFRRHIEAAYMTMWERYQDGKMPESFAV